MYIILRSLVFKWSIPVGLCTGTDHSKFEPFKNWTLKCSVLWSCLVNLVNREHARICSSVLWTWLDQTEWSCNSHHPPRVFTWWELESGSGLCWAEYMLHSLFRYQRTIEDDVTECEWGKQKVHPHFSGVQRTWLDQTEWFHNTCLSVVFSCNSVLSVCLWTEFKHVWWKVENLVSFFRKKSNLHLPSNYQIALSKKPASDWVFLAQESARPWERAHLQRAKMMRPLRAHRARLAWTSRPLEI